MGNLHYNQIRFANANYLQLLNLHYLTLDRDVKSIFTNIFIANNMHLHKSVSI